RLSFRSTPFSPYQFNTVNDAGDSPWLFFDDQADGFLLSAADNFMVARSVLNADNTMSNGIGSDIHVLPAGTSSQTFVAVGSGINWLFETWGRALTSLHGKARPSNDADVTLDNLGYWTDT